MMLRHWFLSTIPGGGPVDTNAIIVDARNWARLAGSWLLVSQLAETSSLATEIDIVFGDQPPH